MARTGWRRLLLIASVGLGLACSREPSQRREGSVALQTPAGEGLVLSFDLSQPVPESSVGGWLAPTPASRTFLGLTRALERAAGDTEATGLFVRLGTSELDWPQTEEIGRLLAKVRDAGKPVVCHAHSLSNRSSWLLASGCSRLWLSPAGDVDTVGIAGQTLHLKALFERYKIQADFLHMGRYKSAAETFTHDAPSPEAREALGSVYGSIRQSWLAGFAAARSAVAVAALEGGPWLPEEARAKQLVDRVGYESEAEAEAWQLAGAKRQKVAFGVSAGVGPGLDLGELIRVLSGADARTSGRPQVVVLPALGAIAMSGGGLGGGGGISAAAFTKTLRKLARDESVRAVVLRIDSPGGSALASDLLWHELRLLAAEKPLIASVGGMAASGGYYMAVAADVIVAERTSIVGSIGVVGGKVVVGAALAELGVNTATVAASPEPGAEARAAYMSPFIAWDEATRERVRAQMSGIYELFLERVAQGRKVSKEQIREVAEGRIWTGAQGQERHLVDELGGLTRALELARQRAGVDADAPVRLEGVGETLMETLLLPEGAGESATRAALERLALRRGAAERWVPAALAPSLGSYLPLASGERVVCALPFAWLSP